MEKETIILYPSLGMGHLLPMIQLAKLFTSQSYSATIVLLDPPFPDIPSVTPSFLSDISSSHPSISFHRLPKPDLPSVPNPASLIFQIFSFANPLLLHFLTRLSLTTNVRALILDMFCPSALPIANDLNIPSYFFFTSGASSLAAFLYFQTLLSSTNHDFKDLGDAPVQIPGCAPIPASHLLEPIQVRDTDSNRSCLHIFSRLTEANGILVNSFTDFEPRAVQALREGLCVPGRKMPPVYCIGPIVADESMDGEERRHECLTWLDKQEKGSVVFLCFGSMGSFPVKQVKEIAIGLERSRQRFLWCVRSPRKNDIGSRLEKVEEVGLEELMPEGFMERTKEVGLVVKNWVPQVEVLRHDAIGGFVTHCGWNSVMEAVSAGVGMICWPLYAEQKMNKVLLVEEVRVGVGMDGYDKKDGVRAEEVERKVRWLMEEEGGKELKERAKRMKEFGVAAKNGGSSEKDWLKFVGDLRSGSGFKE